MKIQLERSEPAAISEDINTFLARCESEDRAARLVEVLQTATKKEAKELLLEWFNVCDAIGSHASELRKQFEKVGFISDSEEKLKLPATIYRAAWEDSDPLVGLSWTLDYNVAERFARSLFGLRARLVLGIYRPGVAAVIIRATCTKAHAYITSRNEAEVIPAKIHFLEEVNRFWVEEK